MISYEQALSRVAERTIANQRDLSQSKKQRRTGFVDLYGVESFRSISGSGSFYISVSPDLEYFERYQFKLAIENASSVADVRLKIKKAGDSDANAVDLTPYLMEQQGSWITGNGIYPSDDITEESSWTDFYDLLDTCGLLIASGEQDAAEMILTPGLREIKISGITADVSLILYMKYSHINR